MAHEISIVDGVAEAAFAYKPAWHGLGTVLDGLMTPQGALDAAHLRWEVEKRPLRFDAGETNVGGLVPDKVSVFRIDTNQYFGTVGSDWMPVQNEQQARFVEALVGSGGVVECVGALREGRRTFWTIKVPGEVVVGDADKVDKYLVVCNGHDGSLAFRAFWSPIRVVCQNTLSAALSNIQESVALFHRSNVMDHLGEAQRVLGVANKYYNAVGERFSQLLDRLMTDAEFKMYVDAVIPGSSKEGGPTPMETIARETITRNYFETGIGRELAGRTAWGAYNAVAEYVSHQKEYSSSDRRFENVLIGGAREIQQKAFRLASAMC